MDGIRSYLIIYLSFFLVLVLYVFPLPMVVNSLRPSWLVLIVFYWVLALPDKIGAMHACFLGLLVDILLGSTLGVHALLLSLISYFVTRNYQKIRNASVLKRTLTLGVLVLANHVLLYWAVSFTKPIVLHGYSYYFPVLTSMLVWPWFFLLMRFVRRKFKVK